MILRLAALIAAMIMSMTGSAKKDDFGGRVIDEKGEPMPYVNVVLLSMPDSGFVQGAMTDEQGAFRFPTDKKSGLLKVTCVGYETLYLDTQATDGLTIQMKEDAQMLGEVVVKSQLPKTFVKGDAMCTNVAGTILEKSGTASDMLSKVPSLEAERDGAVKVLGRGEAEVYINGRKMRDNSELTRLRADQIQSVEVVQNPGARYSASTKAVVRITLKKAQGEGFSFQDYASGMYQYSHTITNNLDVNYRTGGLDITASFWAGRYGHQKQLQDNRMYYYVGPDRYEGVTHQEGKNIWKGWSPQLQVNYMVNENHSFGAFYKYDRHPSTDFSDMFVTDNYENGVYHERSESDIRQNDQFRKHIFNAYYNGKVGQLSIDLNIDGLFDDTEIPGSTTEQTTAVGEEPIVRKIESNTDNANNFWASKLILTYPIWKGNLSVGSEYSYNHRTDAYDFTATDAVPVKATDTEINESSTAAFLEYGRSFGKLFAQAGLRYEYLNNDYFDFGKRQDEVCRTYSDWFPTAVISMPIGQVQLSLSYRRDIERPNYGNLTSSTIYINRYTYQSGNPYLKPTYTHSITFNAAYKWVNFVANYDRIKQTVTMSTEPFPGSDDPLISLIRPINTAEDYNQLNLSIAARPTFNFHVGNHDIAWHPRWGAFTVLQNYKTPSANGSIITLDRPYVSCYWQNDLELSKGFRLMANAKWAARGDYNNYSITASCFNATLGLQRDFNLHRLGTLNLDFRCNDIFNTNKTEATIYGIRELTSYNPARRTFMLDLTWKFNEARSKYRGSGAGEKQKARM